MLCSVCGSISINRKKVTKHFCCIYEYIIFSNLSLSYFFLIHFGSFLSKNGKNGFEPLRSRGGGGGPGLRGSTTERNVYENKDNLNPEILKNQVKKN